MAQYFAPTRTICSARCFVAITLGAYLGLGLAACGQETLETILDRGYVAHWLVCGPFTPDVEGGIAGALEHGRAPLGERDFMEPLGGVARMRPSHLTEVPTDEGKALWQRAGASDVSLDLSPFFPKKLEGVSFAAFYARAARPTTAYADLQSILGVRVYMNGFLLRKVYGAPLSSTGLDRFLVRFRTGLNLFVVEVPGATFETLAKVSGLTQESVAAWGFQNRPLLQGKSGFEIALSLSPTTGFEGLAFVPRLVSTGEFSGEGDLLKQRTLLRIFNPDTDESFPLEITADFPGRADSIVLRIPPLRADTVHEAILWVPMSGVSPGESVTVDVTLRANQNETRFNTSVNAMRPARRGTVHFLMRPRDPGPSPGDQRAAVEMFLHNFENQLAFLDVEPDYGFTVGGIGTWHPAHTLYPGAWDALKGAILFSRSAALPTYGALDERVADGELLARNLLYGYLASHAMLEDWNPALTLWDAPAMAPQAPQLFVQAGLAGVVHQLPYRGLPELYHHIALDGSTMINRRKKPSAAPMGKESLRTMATVQRRELIERGFTTDIILSQNAGPPPEPFWLGLTAPLALNLPSLRINGGGARDFFESVAGQLPLIPGGIPISGRRLTSYHPGELVLHPDLKQAFTKAESTTLLAERFATFASILGAQYPAQGLDKAWRQLLFAGTPGRVGNPPSTRVFVDTLSALRDASFLSASTLQNAARYIASQIDTSSGSPSNGPKDLALVVLNPSSWTRTDLVEMELELDQAPGISIVDENGNRVGFIADRLRMLNSRIAGARLRFVAKDVPSLGYKTYYVVAQGALPQPSINPGAQIENGLIRLIVDESRGGGIASLQRLDTEEEYVLGLWNDVAAFNEDAERTDGGRELWTTGETYRASESPAKVERRRLGWMEELRISKPFLRGELVRTLTLYDEIPLVFCETRFTGIAGDGHLLASTFSVVPDGLAPVYGERFGAVVGRWSPRPFEYRTHGMDNPSATSAQPAHRWSALSPGDSIRVGRDGSVPLVPASIIYGRGSVLEGTARKIQKALLGRGIPADLWPDETRRLNLGWTDSTEFPNYNDDLYHGAAMRIVVGSPEQNAFTRVLFSQLHPELIGLFSEAMVQGAALFFEDLKVPKGFPPVPTLVLAGLTPARTREAGDDFARQVASNGVYALPRKHYVPLTEHKHPNRGLAVLHSGSVLASAEKGKTLVLLWTHAGKWATNEDGLELPVPGPEAVFRYALYPFLGDWRFAKVPQMGHAYNERLVAVTTGIHVGSQPPEQSFLSVTPGRFIVTAVKPAETRLSVLASESLHPRQGMTVRGYESTGKSVKGTLSSFTALYGASESTVLEQPGDKIKLEQKLLRFEAPAFGIRTLWLQPSSRVRGGQPESIEPAENRRGPVFTRYWKHNEGAAPRGFQPLSVILKGSLDDTASKLRAIVANSLLDEPISGTVSLTATTGWKLAPAFFDYSLKPGEMVEHSVMVLRSPVDELTGGLIASTRFRGKVYQDVLTLDEAPIEIETSRSGNQITVTVANRSGIPARGSVEIVVPVTYWPEMEILPRTSLSPYMRPLYVGPFSEQRFVLTTSGELPEAWMVAKVAANGYVVYKNVP